MIDYKVHLSLNDVQTETFCFGLQDLETLGCDKYFLDFNKEENLLKVVTNNSTKSIILFLKFNDSFLSNSQITDNLKFGIAKGAEFLAAVNLLKTNSLDIKLKNDQIFFSQGDYELNYFACNPKIPRVGPDGIGGLPPSQYNIVIDTTQHKSFIKAMSTFEHGFVIIKAVPSEKQIILAITDKDVKTSSFSLKIPCPEVTTALKVVLNKENILALFKTRFEKFYVGINDKIIVAKADNGRYNMTTYLTVAV